MSELRRLHWVDGHVLHLDGAFSRPGSILWPLLAGRVLDEGRRPRLLWHCLGLCCLKLVADNQIQSCSCLLHGLLNLLLVGLLKVTLWLHTTSASSNVWVECTD